MLALSIARVLVTIKSFLLITIHDMKLTSFELQFRRKHLLDLFLSHKPATEFQDGLQTTSFTKNRVQLPDASSWIQTWRRISLGNLQKTVTFNPKPTWTLNYFLKPQIWSRYLQGQGIGRAGPCFAQTAGIPGKMPGKDSGVIFAKLSF